MSNSRARLLMNFDDWASYDERGEESHKLITTNRSPKAILPGGWLSPMQNLSKHNFNH